MKHTRTRTRITFIFRASVNFFVCNNTFTPAGVAHQHPEGAVASESFQDKNKGLCWNVKMGKTQWSPFSSKHIMDDKVQEPLHIKLVWDATSYQHYIETDYLHVADLINFSNFIFDFQASYSGCRMICNADNSDAYLVLSVKHYLGLIKSSWWI